MKNLQQHQLHWEGAGGSIHSQDQLHSFVGLHKTLIFGDLHVGPHSETVWSAWVKGRWGCTSSASFEIKSGPQGEKTKGEHHN